MKSPFTVNYYKALDNSHLEELSVIKFDSYEDQHFKFIYDRSTNCLSLTGNYATAIFDFSHKYTKTIVTGHTPTALISGMYDKTHKIIHTKPFNHCDVLTIQYDNEPARIFTDNGNHSRYPKHDGNVVVLDNKGTIINIYNYDHPNGTNY